MNLSFIRVNHDLVNLYAYSTDEPLDIRFEYVFFFLDRQRVSRAFRFEASRFSVKFPVLQSVYVSVVRYLDVETF